MSGPTGPRAHWPRSCLRGGGVRRRDWGARAGPGSRVRGYNPRDDGAEDGDLAGSPPDLAKPCTENPRKRSWPLPRATFSEGLGAWGLRMDRSGVAILGYGRFGRALAQLVEEAGFPVRALDSRVTVPGSRRADGLAELVARQVGGAERSSGGKKALRGSQAGGSSSEKKSGEPVSGGPGARAALGRAPKGEPHGRLQSW